MMMHYLDSQECYFKMGNNGPVDVSYITLDTPKMLNKQSSEFWNHKIVLDYNVTVNELPKDFKNIAGFEIGLQRYSRKYITYYYIPSGLLAIISCVSKLHAHVIGHFFYMQTIIN